MTPVPTPPSLDPATFWPLVVISLLCLAAFCAGMTHRAMRGHTHDR